MENYRLHLLKEAEPSENRVKGALGTLWAYSDPLCPCDGPYHQSQPLLEYSMPSPSGPLFGQYKGVMCQGPTWLQDKREVGDSPALGEAPP